MPGEHPGLKVLLKDQNDWGQEKWCSMGQAKQQEKAHSKFHQMTLLNRRYLEHLPSARSDGTDIDIWEKQWSLKYSGHIPCYMSQPAPWTSPKSLPWACIPDIQEKWEFISEWTTITTIKIGKSILLVRIDQLLIRSRRG